MEQQMKGVRAKLRQTFGKYSEPVTFGEQTAELFITTEAYIENEDGGAEVVIKGMRKSEPMLGVTKAQVIENLEKQKDDLITAQKIDVGRIDAQIAEVTAL